MIPLHLITGFLGSGKTSFLLDVAERLPGRNLVFLVNEYSRQAIDPQKLAFTGIRTVSITGGSIFCRCLLTDFLHHLRELPSRFSFPAGKLEAVIVEASGIADPRSAEMMLKESQLDQVYRLSSLVCLVDPGSFLKLITILPNIRAQILAADVALINKTDLYHPSEIDRTEDAVKQIKSNLRILRTQQGRSDWNPFQDEHMVGVKGDYTACRDPHFATAVLSVPRMLTLEQLQTAIRPWEDRIFRIKGTASLDGSVFSIEYSSDHWNVQKAMDGPTDNLLVFFYPPSLENEIRELAQHLQIFSRRDKIWSLDNSRCPGGAS